MYAKDTVLVLKEQRPADEENGEDFPYNRVKVVGESPVSHAHKGDWTGPDAAGVLLSPLTNFGATLDEPFGKCKTLYNVESIPEAEVAVNVPVKVIDSQTAAAGPTPEEVFASDAPGVPPEPGQRRGRGGVSPLGDVQNPATVSVLDAPAVAPTPVPDSPQAPVDPPQPAGPPSEPPTPPAAPAAAPEED